MIIYIARNKVNGKCYIGKTCRGLPQRRLEHERDATKGSNLVFHCALRKYGLAAFEWEVLFEGKNEAVLLRMEAHFIELEGSRSHGYNCTEGGEGTAGLKWRPESRAKLAASKMGTKASEAARETMRRNRKGRRVSAEAKRKISEKLTGLKRPPRTAENRAKISAKLRGRKLTPEHIENIRRSLTGRPKPEGFGQKISAILLAKAADACKESE